MGIVMGCTHRRRSTGEEPAHGDWNLAAEVENSQEELSDFEKKLDQDRCKRI
jgi:hypothetical protein